MRVLRPAASDATSESVPTMLPTDKLRSADIWAAYGVRSANTYVLTDWFGNEVQRFTSRPQSAALQRSVEGISASVERANSRGLRDVERVESVLEGGDHTAALRSLSRIFRAGQVGHEYVVRATDVYLKVLDMGRDQMDAAADAGDREALEAMLREFRGTELEPEINAKLEKLSDKPSTPARPEREAPAPAPRGGGDLGGLLD